MVSPSSSVSTGGGVAHVARIIPAAATASASASEKLLRQDFERDVVRGTTLLHLGHRGLVVFDCGVEPVESTRRPGDRDGAILVGLESHRLRRVAVTRATRDDLHLEILRRFAIEHETELRGLACIEVVGM